MAYQFPVGYQNYYPQYNNYNQMQNQQQSSGIIWVQGEAGAKSYLVAPNSTVQLWDSDENVIYLKSADASGMPSIKVLDYTVRETPENKTAVYSNKAIYATKDDILNIQKQIDEIKSLRASGKERQHESPVQRNNAEQ